MSEENIKVEEITKTIIETNLLNIILPPPSIIQDKKIEPIQKEEQKKQIKLFCKIAYRLSGSSWKSEPAPIRMAETIKNDIIKEHKDNLINIRIVY